MTTRPRYATAATTAAEDALVAQFAARMRADWQRQPDRCVLDYVLVRAERVVAAVEAKVRTYTVAQVTRLGGYLLARTKAVALQSWVRDHGLPAILLVRFADAVRYLLIDSCDWLRALPVIWAGRRDRADWQDMEPCVLIPLDGFRAAGVA